MPFQHSGAAEPLPRPSVPVPLVVPAVGLCAGIVLDDRWSVGLPGELAGFLVFVAIALLVRRTPWWSKAALMAAALFVGALLHDSYQRRYPADHIRRYSADHPVLVTMVGRILTRPQLSAPQGRPQSRWLPADPRTRFLMQAEQLAGRDRPIPVTGKVQVTVKAPVLRLAAGDRVRLDGKLYRLRPAANPGQFAWDRRQRLHRILVGLSIARAESITPLPGPPLPTWKRWLQTFRDHARRLLVADVLPDDPAGVSLIEAMVLGRRSRVDRAIDEAFRRTGTAHFLSVSGLHVGMLVLFAWGVGLACGLPRRPRAWFVCAVLIAYMLLAEPRVPVLRAGIMVLLACIGLARNRSITSLNWVAAAAIVVLAVQPTQIFLPGFQLSFGVVLSILLLLPVFERWVIAPREQLRRLADRPFQPWFTRYLREGFVRGVLRVILAGTAAWIGAWPIVAYHFNIFSPYGFISSAVLFPFVFVTIILAFGKLLLAVIAPPAGALLALPVSVMIKLLANLVRWMAEAPGTILAVSSPPLWWLPVYYGLLGVIVYRAKRDRRWSVPAAALALWIGLRLLPGGAGALPADTVRITVLSVGAGSATVISLPNGRHLIYDAGSMSPYSIYRSTLRPYLRHVGIDRIEHVVVSHANLDHMIAIPELLDDCRVATVWISPHFDVPARPRSPAAWFIKEMNDRKQKVLRLVRGEWLADTGAVKIDALWPPARIDPGTAANDTSIVLRIRYGQRTVLLCGDIEEQAIEKLLDLGGLGADVLLLPHHGSVVPHTKAFIEAVNPAIVLRSSGQPDRYTQTNLLELVQGRTYFNTADDGAVTVYVSPDGVRAHPFRPRRRGTKTRE